MSDEASVVETAETSAAAVAQTGSESPETGTEETAEQVFLGDYRSKEEAEKGIAEKDSLIGKLGSEVGDLKSRLSEYQSNADAAKAMREVAEALKPKEQAPDWAAQKRQWVEQYGEDQAEILAASLSTTNSWIEQEREKIKSDMNKELSELKGAVAAEREARIKLSPDYIQNKDLAESFVAKGMALNDAVEMASIIGEKIAPKAPERALPSSVDGSRVTTKEPEKFEFDDEYKSYLATRGLTAEDIEELRQEKEALMRRNA